MSRPLASLSSGLLARPGGAKPAMRPQAFGYAPTEDLGWNDLGSAVAAPPPVLAERAALAKAVTATTAAATPAASRRTAFTLRLDHERHLRLRLAGAVSGCSSQQIVMEALDAFLDAQPQVDARAPKLAAAPHSGEK